MKLRSYSKRTMWDVQRLRAFDLYDTQKNTELGKAKLASDPNSFFAKL